MYRLSKLQTTGSGSVSIQKFAYTYDPVGNLTEIDNTASTSAAAMVAYSYDNLNRLLSAVTTSASSSPYSNTYTYDALGNITQIVSSTSTTVISTSSPAILDTLNLTRHAPGIVTSDSFSYTVPNGGNNKVLMLWLAGYSGTNYSATQNGSPIAITRVQNGNAASEMYGYLVNPSSGTFNVSSNIAGGVDYYVYTVSGADQTNPIDAVGTSTKNGTYSFSVATTTTKTANDLVLDFALSGASPGSSPAHGGGQTEYAYETTNPVSFGKYNMSYNATTTVGSVGETEYWVSNNQNFDDVILGIKGAGAVPAYSITSNYTYGGTGYANPDAVTQIANGLSTTTFTYDNNGNVTQKTVDGTTTAYVYDYANRLTALGVGGATTTYGYDAFGQRVLQTGTTTTYIYPFKWYSVASSTGSGAKYATTTDYVFNSDTLLATVDQQTASGVATGTAKTRYIHPDHLGSTNVVTDASGTVVQTLDYYPYGATRINTNTGGDSARKYVDRFGDQSNLDYLNARYYDPTRGQFITEDPVFWSSKQELSNPQSLNSYSYANDNPISGKDPDGLSAQTALQGVLNRLQTVLVSLLTLISQPSFVTYAQAAQAGFANASHPVQSVQAAVSAGYSYVSSTGSALNTIGRSDSGDYLLGQRAVDLILLLGLKDVPVSVEGDAAAGDSLAFPSIKAGSAGGETAGKPFPNSVKQAARAENPTATCVFCHTQGTGTTVDHSIPRNSGGNATVDNAQLACPHCNSSKGANQFPLTPPPGYVGQWPPAWWSN
jgi:RHS repeat-associated protein